MIPPPGNPARPVRARRNDEEDPNGSSSCDSSSVLAALPYGLRSMMPFIPAS